MNENKKAEQFNTEADNLRSSNARQTVREEAAKIPKRRVDVQIMMYNDVKEAVKGIKVGEHLAVTESAVATSWRITHLPTGMAIPGNYSTRQEALEAAWLINQGVDWSQNKAPSIEIACDTRRRLAWYRGGVAEVPEFLQPVFKATEITETAQQSQVDAYVVAAKDLGKTTVLYKNKKGQVLVATEYNHGLSRVVVDKDGSYESLGSGPVDESQWAEISPRTETAEPA